MEGKGAVRIENQNSRFGLSAYFDPQQLGVYENIMFQGGGDKSSLGFMELLGMNSSSCSTSAVDYTSQVPPSTVQPASNDSPNSSSISSASSEALNDELAVIKTSLNNKQEQKLQKTAKKQLKAKKTNQKRQREARFAFMTRSEVDHLEDGYRWRKYGQKAVKNSPFPRSYYRCTNATCNVKKRVERSFSDPTIVVTTYEGQHTHSSPVTPRSSFVGAAVSDSCFSSVDYSFARTRLSLYQQQQQLAFGNCFKPNLGFGNCNGSVSSNGGFVHHDHHIKHNCTLLEDYGLLQDVVPSHMLKE